MGDNVFICYSREDDEFVLNLATNLKSRGIPVWLDQWDIPNGSDWDLTIDNALYDCAHFLIILSPTSVESKEVRSELRTALDENKHIVPVLRRSCRIPRQLRLIQYIDFTLHSPDDMDALSEISIALGKVESHISRQAEITVLREKLSVPSNNESNPEEAINWNNNGVDLSNLRKYDEAIKAFDKTIELDSNSAPLAWGNKGVTLNFQGKYDEAIKACDKAIKLDPKLAMAWENKGDALLAQGKYEAAIRACDKAIELEPKRSKAWNKKGVALHGLGKYDESIKAYDEAIRMDHDFAVAWSNKGNALVGQGEYDDAIKAYEEAIRIDPKRAKDWNNKGNALKQLGRNTEADAAFAKAEELGI
jgi:tetratricopeptide (TPR) repeat protein